MPALACLTSSFEAVYPGDRIAELFGAAARPLIRRGVLRDLGASATIPRCICELRRTECTVVVDVGEDGGYVGYCNEYGAPIAVSPEMVQRYAFDWAAWAAALRKDNRLAGPEPALGHGCVYVGSGTAADRAYRLVVVAPAQRRRGSLLLPDVARAGDAPLVIALLGAGPIGTFDGIAVDAGEVMHDDLLTLDADRFEALLVDAPVVIKDETLTHQVFSLEHPTGRPVTSAECDSLRGKRRRDTFDLFIDLLTCKVWRKGRPCATELNGEGRSTGKKLGGTSVRLLADYVRRPGRPMAPYQAPTYRDTVIEPRSASVRFSAVRRSIRGSSFLPLVESGSSPGHGTYAFEPGDLTYCVVEAISTPRPTR